MTDTAILAAQAAQARAETDAIKAKFTPDEVAAHVKLRELLWVLYPREESLNTMPAADEMSDGCAAMLIDGLRLCGFRIVRT